MSVATYTSKRIGRVRIIINPSSAVVAFITSAGVILRATLAGTPAAQSAAKRFGVVQTLPDNVFYCRLNASLL